VIETDRFVGDIDRGWFKHSAAAKVTERLTRTSPTEIVYEFVVDDPKTYTQPWRGEMVFRAAKGPIY
jgi:hypothetical protein